MADSKQFKIKEIINIQPKALPASGQLGDLAMDAAGDLYKWDGASWVAAGVSAATDVPYSNATSGLTAVNVQTAIDEVEGRVDTAAASLTTLAPITALTGEGVVAITGAGTAALRTLTGTSDQITITDGNAAAGNPTIAITSNPIIPGTAHLTIPVGTTAQRPGSPTDGMVRRNTTLNKFEGYDSISASWKPLGGGGRDILATSDSPFEVVAGTGITGITDVDQVLYVSTAAGEVDVTANPQIVAGTSNGQVLTVIGTSDLNYPLLQHGTGLSLNGEFEACNGCSLRILWDNTSTTWIEIARKES